ncbi:MAG: protein kinase [Ardenticatenaceae bacterium]|nr:protein kinase [Ardenticatenaceae bacterium]MCB8991124.1 protein kinase [Ardenticatenaceae bacterium]MCB9005280.1 protein kinase [Ardenticatenaceae bacterium]
MSQPTWIGQTLNGRYRIEELLGQGGMSAVYKATDPNLRRVVAIKLIHSHLSNNPNFVRRFEEEAAAVAQLRHPNIVQVFDFNHDGETYYIVFEFVPGETLQARLARLSKNGRTLPLNETLQIAASMGDALDYAHKRGLVHRDIKPANIMLNVHNEAILTDFGIVKITGGTQHTATGAVLGTAQYMSPEQIRGTTIDARSDIYSLGVALFEMVGGRPPFTADSAMSLMMMHVTDPVPDLHNIRPDTPPGLVAIIEKALAKDPAQRYQSAAQMVGDLRQVQMGQPPRTAVAPAAVAPPNAGRTMVEDGGRTVVETAVPVTPPSYPTEVVPFETPQPVPMRPAAANPSPAKTGNRNWMIAGGVVGVLIIIAAILGFSGVFGGGDKDGTPVATQQVAGGGTAVAAVDSTATTRPQATATLAPTAAATATPESTATTEPTATNTAVPSPTNPPTATPTATVPPGLFVRINGITLNESGAYVVDYETFEFTEQLPGVHIHFFFNTVTQENAGMPGSGPWILYGGPRPFTQYTVNDRPATATQMCALVANADHSVQYNTGNCFDLPGG